MNMICASFNKILMKYEKSDQLSQASKMQRIICKHDMNVRFIGRNREYGGVPLAAVHWPHWMMIWGYHRFNRAARVNDREHTKRKKKRIVNNCSLNIGGIHFNGKDRKKEREIWKNKQIDKEQSCSKSLKVHRRSKLLYFR